MRLILTFFSLLGLPLSSAAEDLLIPLSGGNDAVAVQAFVMPEAISTGLNDARVTRDTAAFVQYPERLRREARIAGFSGQVPEVLVSLRPEDEREDRLVVVTGSNAEGQPVASTVQRISPMADAAREVTGECTMSEAIRQAQSGGEAPKMPMAELLQLRENRRTVLRKRLSELLTKENIALLSAEERRYGLRYAQPLSEAISPAELARRLTQLEILRQDESERALPRPSNK